MKVSKKHLLKLLYENDGDEISLVDIVPDNTTVLSTDSHRNVIEGFHKIDKDTIDVIESDKELTLDEFVEDIGKSLNTGSLKSLDKEAKNCVPVDGSNHPITVDNIAEDFLDKEDEVSDLSENLMIDLGILNAFEDETES